MIGGKKSHLKLQQFEQIQDAMDWQICGQQEGNASMWLMDVEKVVGNANI